MPWRLTTRAGPRVERASFDSRDAALAELESRAHSLAEQAPRRTIDARIRRFEPAEQVSARLELAGPQRLLPSVRAGVDVHGDGSMRAYLGLVRRRIIEPARSESPLDALRRELAGERGQRG